MKKIFGLIIISSLMVGCNSNPKDDLTRTVKINSVPEGASIIVNNLPLGKTPVEVEFEANEMGCFVRKTLITALPQDDALHTQMISYPGYNKNNPEVSLIPESITFNMYATPESKKQK